MDIDKKNAFIGAIDAAGLCDDQTFRKLAMFYIELKDSEGGKIFVKKDKPDGPVEVLGGKHMEYDDDVWED